MRRRRDREVLALLGVLEIGARARPAAGVVDRGLIVADAFLGGAVEIGVFRYTGLDRGVVHGLGECRLPRMVLHLERPAGTVEVAAAARVVLRTLEVGQHRVVVPAFAAALAPFVVIGGVAAHVDHAVDRAGAAQHLAARLIHDAAVEFGLGFRIEHPVDLRIVEGLVIAERHVDPRIGVLGPRLEQQHAEAPVLAQATRDGAASRAGAGDDEDTSSEFCGSWL